MQNRLEEVKSRPRVGFFIVGREVAGKRCEVVGKGGRVAGKKAELLN